MTSLPVGKHDVTIMTSLPVCDYVMTSLPVGKHAVNLHDITIMTSLPVYDYVMTSLPAPYRLYILLIGEMGDLTKSDADIAVQPTSEKRSYVQHLEVVAISAAEKTILRKSACEKRKSSERNQCGLCQEMNLPIREIQYRLWNWSQAKTIPL